jgi:hypothetical protein
MIQTKHDVGDKVWVATFQRTEYGETCPDCLGEKAVTVTTPAGESFTVACQTCRHGYESTGLVSRWEYTGHVWQGTIGSVRVDTHDDEPVGYMLVETGVGSGTIHREANLYSTIEDAESASVELAAAQTRMIAERNAKERKRKRSALCFRQRWERHAKGLCAAARALIAHLDAIDERRLGHGAEITAVERYLKWINPDRL